MASTPCIGMFDSGIGGLSILAAVREHLPDAPIRYVADSAHAPYGERSDAEILERCERIVDHLLGAGAGPIVVACNTATAVAIQSLRARYPGASFVGVEPGVRPAAAASRRRRIAVMATTATLRSLRFRELLAREAGDCSIHLQACRGLADAIERGRRDDPALLALIAQHAGVVRDAGVDAVALGCTHYPFVRAEIEEVLGSGVVVIDTAKAVAAQVGRQWRPGPARALGSCVIETTGEPERLADFVAHWLGLAAEVRPQRLAI
jgi:glutamate racemase